MDDVRFNSVILFLGRAIMLLNFYSSKLKITDFITEYINICPAATKTTFCKVHYVNVSVLIKFSQKTSVFTLIIISSP